MYKQRWILILLLLSILSAAGCSLSQPVANGGSSNQAIILDTTTPATEVAAAPETAAIDEEALAARVLAEVQAQLATAQAQETLSNIAYEANTALNTNDLESTLINLYQQANPAVVYIVVPSVGSGSGFVYSEDGYIVTNNHVVSGSRSFEVVFANGDRMAAELVGTDVDSDLAVIKVAQLPEGVKPLPLANSDDAQVGQMVVAIGNPFGEQGSMSLGIVSGLGRSLESQRQLGSGSSYSLPDVIQTDAPINPGNSGGPLLNLAGQVVGINSAIASTTGTNSGVGFAIPVNAVRRIVPSLITDGSYAYPYMGAGFDAEVSLEEQSVYGLTQTQGTYVVSVTPGSPAEKAGLIAADPTTGRGGDLIIAIDGLPIQDFGDMNKYLVFNTSVGQTVELTVLRSGETITLSLTLGERP